MSQSLSLVKKSPVSFQANPAAYGLSRNGRMNFSNIHKTRALVRPSNKLVIPGHYDVSLQQPLSLIEGLETTPNDLSGLELPQQLLIDPKELWVDENWQREMTASNIGLIQHIVASWNWLEFHAPNVVIWPDGRKFVTDGRTTSTAALHHPQIDQIPILAIRATQEHLIKLQAEAFVSLNSRRISVPRADLLTALIHGGDEMALTLADIVRRTGVKLLRLQRNREFASGETMAAGELRHMLDQYGPVVVEQICRICCKAQFRPIRRDHLHAVSHLIREKRKAPIDEKLLIWAIRSISHDHALAEAQLSAQKHGITRPKALARLYKDRLEHPGKYESIRTVGNLAR